MLAPELEVERWLHTEQPLTLATLRGRVVLMVAFQMRCTGCVVHSIPQLQRMHDRLASPQVAVLGLHTVFESHDAMTAEALEGFVRERGLTMPIGIDRPSDTRIPRTMRAYHMQGTPTLVLIDTQGKLRMVHLGPLEDDVLTEYVARLVRESES